MSNNCMGTDKQILSFIAEETKLTSALSTDDVLDFVYANASVKTKGLWPYRYAWANAAMVATCLGVIVLGFWITQMVYVPADQLLVVNNIHLENVDSIVGGE